MVIIDVGVFVPVDAATGKFTKPRTAVGDGSYVFLNDSSLLRCPYFNPDRFPSPSRNLRRSGLCRRLVFLSSSAVSTLNTLSSSLAVLIPHNIRSRHDALSRAPHVPHEFATHAQKSWHVFYNEVPRELLV